LVNDAPTTVAATANDFTNDVCRKFPRRMPQATPQRPTMFPRPLPHGSTMFAARFNDERRSHAATVSRRKTAKKTHPEKTGF
jgi:hypothetical protein